MGSYALVHFVAAVTAVTGLSSCDAAFLPASALAKESHLDVVPSHPSDQPPRVARKSQTAGGVLTHSDEWVQLHSRFASHQGILGETIPSENSRHPFWHFEGHQLAKYQAYVCCVVLFLAGILCAAGGIGGGGIYVTLLMVAGKKGVADAVPLSKAIVFFGSISSWVLNSRKLVAWETKRETAIDYNICRLIVPGALGGTLIGVILNRRLPSWIILLVLTVLLVAITISVGVTTVRLYFEECAQDLEDEQAAREASKQAAEAKRAVGSGPVKANGYGSVEAPATQRNPTVADCQAVSAADELGISFRKKPLRVAKFRRPSMNAPDISKMRNRLLWSDCILTLWLLFIVITCGVFRFHAGECLHASPAVQKMACNHPVLFWLGSGTLESWMQHSNSLLTIRRCAIIVPLCLCALMECYYARLLIKYERWRVSEVLQYCILAIFTGCVSGLVGIGGGLIFSPFFLISGVHPSVAVATSSTCVIFTSASTALQYLFTDRIIISLTLVYGAVSLVASYVGTSLVHFLEEHFWGKKSYVSCIVGLGVLVSTVLSVVKLACTGLH
uniref:Membrane transporter protein n=1 Tax=Alexandrium catenella TaxID=2925 RepID=A0A7S1S7B6_ALECA|mmetsp:Transcript_89145/g.236895  ORF Transcript_89145/g.236895 Transcript_89145/m.236895 type:complete len:559 (+) Transcript_89145:85-1761(+)